MATWKQPRFGVIFDVDGVLARGTLAIPAAQKMIKLLQDNKGDVRVPITYVTNSLNKDEDKANCLSNMLSIPVSPKQLVQAQAPLSVFTRFHNKHVLVVGQGKIFEIAKDLGFKNMCSIDDVREAYPLLDMVDHDNRKRIAKEGYTEKALPRIEAVILMGEPQRWESSLQLIIDLLLTDGKPDHMPTCMPTKHLPVIACNMDLQFMDRARIPRYGHVAYLVCLESLYKKVTGSDLKYTALIGKPSEITFRYAEHCMAREAKRLGIEEPLERMYVVGDTLDSDIVGCNLYQRYIDRLHTRRSNNEINDEDETSGDNKSTELIDQELPQCRNCPVGTQFLPQSVEEAISLLVLTGVYKPGATRDETDDEKHSHSHRDFPKIPELYKPKKICDDVLGAIEYILKKEQICFQ